MTSGCIDARPRGGERLGCRAGRRRFAEAAAGRSHPGMSGKSIELDRWLLYAGEAGQPGGKGWVQLSSRGVQEGQEVDPAQPPVPNPRSGMSGSRDGCVVHENLTVTPRPLTLSALLHGSDVRVMRWLWLTIMSRTSSPSRGT
jgi:hypothetical protein